MRSVRSMLEDHVEMGKKPKFILIIESGGG
jgi:hypothetical protein